MRLAMSFFLFTGLLLSADVSVTYSDFGPNLAFASGTNQGWCVSGSLSPDCGPEVMRQIAVPFTPQADFTVTQFQLALNWVSGANAMHLTIFNDAGGRPGTTNLGSWTASNVPSSPGVITINAGNPGGAVTLSSGTYWLVASAPSVTSTALMFWWENNQNLSGGETSTGGGGWTSLGPGATLPAVAITGTQAAPNPPSSGCTGSTSQVCPLLPASASAPVISLVSSSAIPGTSANAIAPGELITIKGTNLGPAIPDSFTVTSGFVKSALDTVVVIFDGTPGTPLYVSPTQVNVIVPWEVAGRGSTNMALSFNGMVSNVVPLSVSGVAPAIFTQDASGSGQTIALNLAPGAASIYNVEKQILKDIAEGNF